MHPHPEALSKIMAGIRCGVMLHTVGHPQTIIAELAPAGIGSAIVSTYECERVGRLDSANGAVIRIVYEIFHRQLQRIGCDCQQVNRILMIVPQVIAAGVTAIVGENKFIPAQRVAPEPFIAYRAHTIPAIAGPFIQAQYIMALIFVTCGIGYSRYHGKGKKRSKHYKANVFHKSNLNG